MVLVLARLLYVSPRPVCVLQWVRCPGYVWFEATRVRGLNSLPGQDLDIFAIHVIYSSNS